MTRYHFHVYDGRNYHWRLGDNAELGRTLVNTHSHKRSARGIVARARGQIAVGDIAGARLLLEPAAAQDDMDALFALAETYDPQMQWRVIGPRSDDAMARTLYERAAKRGHAEAAARLSAQPR